MTEQIEKLRLEDPDGWYHLDCHLDSRGIGINFDCIGVGSGRDDFSLNEAQLLYKWLGRAIEALTLDKLQVGKYYRTQDGGFVHFIEELPEDNPFYSRGYRLLEESGEFMYRLDGSYSENFGPEEPNPQTLVEITEEEYNNRGVTKLISEDKPLPAWWSRSDAIGKE